VLAIREFDSYIKVDAEKKRIFGQWQYLSRFK
jgi:hypothetical protein